MTSRRFVFLAAVTAAALAGALGLPVHPARAAVSTVSCAPFGTDDLQAKIDAAPPGDTLLIRGTCSGSFAAGINVTLQGAMPGATLSGGGSADVLSVVGTTVTVRNLTLTGGFGAAGAAMFIVQGASVTVIDSDLRGNTARVAGGGIYVDSSTLHVVDSTVDGNTATYKGGGIAAFFATVTVTGSRVVGNSTFDTGGDGAGAGLELYSTDATVTGSAVSGNTAGSSGGGINTEDGAVVTLTGSTVSGNTAPVCGGIENAGQSMTLEGSSVDHNTASAGPGGGIFNDSAYGDTTLDLDNSIVAYNRSLAADGQPFGGGGGIFNFAESGNTTRLVATHLVLAGNSAPQGEGGGIDNENLDGKAALVSISQSLIGSLTGAGPNRAQYGGAIYNDGSTGPASVSLGSGAVVARNQASIEGGGVYNTGAGATLTISPGALVVFNSPDNVVGGH